MSLPLRGRVALVTGSSRGIGRAIALALAGVGADLVLTSTKEGGAEETANAVRRLGPRALAIACDVVLPGSVERLVDRAHQQFQRVDILVNNAGVVFRAPLAQTSDEEFERVLGVNLRGPFHLARRLVPRMIDRRWGRIVNISSISGTVGTSGLSAYCASKWGLNGLTKVLASELHGSGVLAMAVLPGSVDTEMLQGSDFEARMKPEDVAGLVRYVCCEAPAAMNGALVEVFG